VKYCGFFVQLDFPVSSLGVSSSSMAGFSSERVNKTWRKAIKGLTRTLLPLGILKLSSVAPLAYENKSRMLVACEGYHWQGN
jgi:hypothetical protein